MTSAALERARLVIVDARPPTAAPLRGLVERAAVDHEILVVSTADRALEAISVRPPAAVLVHAEIGSAPSSAATGPVIAATCHRLHPDFPLLVYTENPANGHEAELARLGLAVPVVLDSRLIESFGAVLRDLVRCAAGQRRLFRLSRPTSAAAREPSLPETFRIERFLCEARDSLLRVAAREHPDRTRAAAGACLSLRAFLDHLSNDGELFPRGGRPRSIRGQSVLWCSGAQPPPWLAAAAETSEVEVRTVPPGSLRPATALHPATVAVVLEPTDAASAADAWLADRCRRPLLITGVPSAPVGVLLDELFPAERVLFLPEAAAELFEVGRCAAHLYRDERAELRLPYRPDGKPAWPLDVRRLLRRTDARILLLARQAASTLADAAELVGLPERTLSRPG
ncbi:MAG: hypothetical protein HY996_00580 [Micrococcales bacterium]|nr:hypothetical protein [Micrococcales bacterium]